MENYNEVVHQMLQAGCVFKDKDLPLQIPTPKRKTCGEKGKWWYWLQIFRRYDGREFVVGKFGTYKHHGKDWKVDVDWKELSDEERQRMTREREAALEKAKQAKEEAAAYAAMTAGQLWQVGDRDGTSPYLQRKGVTGESCRYLTRAITLARRNAVDKPMYLPAGTLVIPLIRYDLERHEALRGLQFIKPDGFKVYTEGFSKNGCSVRLGEVTQDTRIVLVCEGYATGLSIREATRRQWPVYVALDAYNLVFVVDVLRVLHRQQHLLICADDDWKTQDHDGLNPGRTKARLAAKTNDRCEIVWPVFDPATREEKDTDFNDLHAREGLAAVERQLVRVLKVIENAMEARGA